MGTSVKKIVLAYSGGLDTSVIVRWLQDNYQAEVITFTADIGQGEELAPAREKARTLGVQNIYIEDLRETFVADFVFPMFRANAIYEGEYLLGTSIARPLITKQLVEIAHTTGAHAIAHGATGKGNDQIRFELCAAALDPDIRVIAPWREWNFASRADLLSYCAQHGISVEQKSHTSPYSMDANVLHISYEGEQLEDPWTAPEESMWQLTRAIADAPNEPEDIVLGFAQGDLHTINGEQATPFALLKQLNTMGGKHAIGRIDIVENRMIGMKSRGCYETPGGTILLKAHRAIESLCLDGESAHLKDALMTQYAKLIYNGLWFSPERRALQALIDNTQTHVTGEVRLRLYKGNVVILGRRSERSLFDQKLVTFEDDAGAYDQNDAAGFIKLNALRLKLLKRQH